MADISFLVFHDEHGYYRLEGIYPDEQTRVDMSKEEADAWISAQAEPTLAQCPYCKQWHGFDLIEQCPLKPRLSPLDDDEQRMYNAHIIP